MLYPGLLPSDHYNLNLLGDGGWHCILGLPPRVHVKQQSEGSDYYRRFVTQGLCSMKTVGISNTGQDRSRATLYTHLFPFNDLELAFWCIQTVWR
jgi:hypothetical protein